MASLSPFLYVSFCGHKHSLPWAVDLLAVWKDVLAVSGFRFCLQVLRGPSPLSFAARCPLEHLRTLVWGRGQEHGMKSQKSAVSTWYSISTMTQISDHTASASF